MKRNVISLLLVLVLCLSLAVCVSADSPFGFVVDEADLLTDAEELALSQRLSQISETYQAELTVVTLASVDGKSIDAYVEDFYDQNGLGYGAAHDGVLLMISMDIREYRILSNGMAAEAIMPEDIDIISDWIVSDLSAGNYADAFMGFADKCEFYLDGHINGFAFPFFFMLLIAVGIGLVVGLIVALVLRAQLKSVFRQDYAASYLKAGSLHLNVNSDRFLYRNVTRTRKETNSGSSGTARSTGPSRNVGGGKF